MKKELFKDLVKSIKEAGEIKKGNRQASRQFVYRPMDVKRLRKLASVSQSDFARMIGVSVDTVQNWEQGRRAPRGPARALLKVFESNPETVINALG
jgi:putative transcriptional regulator